MANKTPHQWAAEYNTAADAGRMTEANTIATFADEDLTDDRENAEFFKLIAG